MGFLILSIVMIVVVSWFAATTTRILARRQDERGRSIDQDMVEARLYRIEEAIDAMAVQIERLSEQQQALLTAPPADQMDTAHPERRE